MSLPNERQKVRGCHSALIDYLYFLPSLFAAGMPPSAPTLGSPPMSTFVTLRPRGINQEMSARRNNSGMYRSFWPEAEESQRYRRPCPCN